MIRSLKNKNIAKSSIYTNSIKLISFAPHTRSREWIKSTTGSNQDVNMIVSLKETISS